MSAGFLRTTLFDDVHVAPLYWHEARRPLPTLMFVLPLVLAYEVGVTCLGAQPDALRNGADCWMRSWMLDAGLPYGWVLPGLLIVGLVAWQVVGKYPWRVSFDTLTGMFGESLLFALVLIVAGQSLNIAFRAQGYETLNVAAAGAGATSPAVRAISFLGAGIYEEMMFRLALIPATFYLLRLVLIPRRLSIGLAVVVSSLSFAAAHYLDPQATFALSSLADSLQAVAVDSALWYGFTFRLLAGLAFSLLLLVRGFGITVGCHALYDLLAGVLMQAPGG